MLTKLTLFTGLTAACVCLSAQSRADATYSVPVPNPLKAYAQFQVADPQIAVLASGNSTVTYNLPPELVGPNAPSIVLTGSAATYNGTAAFQLTGDQANANCNQDGGVTTCDVQFKNLPIDQPAVSSFLKQVSKTPMELSGRSQVFASFEGDPHGILIYGISAPKN